MRLALILLALVFASTANAETRLGVSLSVNPPWRWHGDGAFGASALVGVQAQHAIRASAAAYVPHYVRSNTIDQLRDGGLHGGRGVQASVGWQYYPGWFGIETNTSRGVWRGFFFDVGAQVRHDDAWHQPFYDIGDRERFFTRRTGLGAKGLLGFSWTQRHVFVSIAVGTSLGFYRGTKRHETYREFPDRMETTSMLYEGLEPAVEGFARVGVAFGI